MPAIDYYRWYPATQTATTTSSNWVRVITTSSATSTWYVSQFIEVADNDWVQRTWERDCRDQAARAMLYVRPTPTQQRTPEQIAEQARLALERQEATKAAAKRARDLLLEHLTPAQRKTFEEHKWFIVTGGKSGTKYRIRDVGHFVANIDVFEGRNMITHRLCAHVPTDKIPAGDNLLAQKMMIEYDEEAFVRTANRHPAAA